MKKRKDKAMSESEIMAGYFRKIGSKGGRVAAEHMSAAERRKRAKRAVAAREAKRKRKGGK